MNSLLGVIREITTNETQPTSMQSDGLRAVTVKLKPRCVLPKRDAVPEWLKEATVTIQRDVADMREIGVPGDSIVLTVAESQKYLRPLIAEPMLTQTGDLPEAVTLTLRWWKEAKAPDITVTANGRTETLKFPKPEGAAENNKKSDVQEDADKKDEEGKPFVPKSVTFSPRGLFLVAPTLPVTFAIECDKMKAKVVALPQRVDGFHAIPHATHGETWQARNPFLKADILASAGAGGVIALTEIERGYDHFAQPDDIPRNPFQSAGHLDTLNVGWNQIDDKITPTAMTCSGTRLNGDGAALSLSGSIEDDLRTNVVVMLDNSLPLLTIRREYQFTKAEEKDKKDNVKPKEPSDDLKFATRRFRAAFRIETDDAAHGTRLLCGDGQRLYTFRGAQPFESVVSSTWRLRDGWAMVEQPITGGRLLYLFDGANNPPYFGTWRDTNSIALEPVWNSRAFSANTTIGYDLAMAAGEAAGANDNGAWVACRASDGNEGVIVGVIARLRDVPEKPVAEITVGGATRTVPLEKLRLAGIGSVWTATTIFGAGGDPNVPLSATVAEISMRPTTTNGATK